MKKRFIAAFLLIGMLISVLPAAAETQSFDNLIFGEDYSRKIVVTDFTFNPSSALAAGGTVTASCNIKTAEGVSASQSCTLIVMVYSGGKLFDLKTGTVTANGTAQPLTLSAPANLPSDITNVKVYAYIWTDFLSLRNGFLQPRILARPATFGSSSNSLYELNINGTPLDIDAAFASGDTYVCELDKFPQNLPQLTAEADDLGADVVINNVTSLPGIASVDITSQTGERKTYNVEFSVKENKRTLENAISDDTNSRTNQYLTNYSPTGIWMQTNLYNGVPMNNNFNGTLKRAMIQIDVTSFPDITPLIKDIQLTVNGQCNYNASHITAYCPAEFTVNAYDFTGYEWSESTLDAASTSVGPTLNDITAKTPFDSFVVEKSDSTAGPWVEKSISIKELIVNAKANDISKVTVILLADNTSRYTPELEALKNQNSNNRDELMFVMGTRENTTEARRPKVELIEYISE